MTEAKCDHNQYNEECKKKELVLAMIGLNLPIDYPDRQVTFLHHLSRSSIKVSLILASSGIGAVEPRIVTVALRPRASVVTTTRRVILTSI